jgi:hypothetical protein
MTGFGPGIGLSLLRIFFGVCCLLSQYGRDSHLSLVSPFKKDFRHLTSQYDR